MLHPHLGHLPAQGAPCATLELTTQPLDRRPPRGARCKYASSSRGYSWRPAVATNSPQVMFNDAGITVGETVALAVRRFRQDQIGRQLAAPLTTAEVEWLDAELG